MNDFDNYYCILAYVKTKNVLKSATFQIGMSSDTTSEMTNKKSNLTLHKIGRGNNK